MKRRLAVVIAALLALQGPVQSVNASTLAVSDDRRAEAKDTDSGRGHSSGDEDAGGEGKSETEADHETATSTDAEKPESPKPAGNGSLAAENPDTRGQKLTKEPEEEDSGWLRLNLRGVTEARESH